VGIAVGLEVVGNKFVAKPESNLEPITLQTAIPKIKRDLK
jgi:hypothetical protein